MIQVRDSFLNNTDCSPYSSISWHPTKVKDINNGFCADWATLVWEQFREVNIVNDEEMGAKEYSHTFLEYKGLYYDAECIDGVEDWTQLPIFLR